ncbi:hypothetical protein WICPIJ_000716, partial [Wickerhamomyces pijperi]
KVPVETGVTVITTTTNGVETIYTTYCPLTASTATVEAEHTTVVTVTSCSGGVCTKVPVETGVTVITTTTNGVETIYTTYCPLTASNGPAPATVVSSGASTTVRETHTSPTGTKVTFGSYDVVTYTTQSLVTDTIVYCPLTNSEGQTTSTLIIPSGATGAVEGTSFHTSDLLTTTSVHTANVIETATVTQGGAHSHAVTGTTLSTVISNSNDSTVTVTTQTTTSTEAANYETGSTSTTSVHPTSPVVHVSNDGGLALQANRKSLTIGILTFLVYSLF